MPRDASVADRGHPLIGSPISLTAIGRVEGFAETSDAGVRGWAWHPGDAETDPCLTVTIGGARRQIVASEPMGALPGQPPFARPRSFALSWGVLPDRARPIQVFGRDGRELAGGRAARHNEVAARRAPGPSCPGVRAVAKHDDAGEGAIVAARPDPARRGANGSGTVLLVTHADGGGVEQRVQAAAAAHIAAGRRAIVLRPARSAAGDGAVELDDGQSPIVRVSLPRQRAALLRLLRAAAPAEIELHHLLNHDPSLVRALGVLGAPYDVHIHDFAWFCPRIALVGRGDRYCGEPSPDLCEVCVAEKGSYLHEDIAVPDLLRRSAALLEGARRVIAPSRDAADRMARHFPGLIPSVVPHEDDSAVPEPPPLPVVAGTVKICVAGAIGLHKGFHVLLGCARDARKRGLDLTFVVVGGTIDDQRLMDTGRVFVTGPYRAEEAPALIRAQNAALALLPSIWPETWCLSLTALWRGGLRVAAFDFGAPAERIRQTGRGFLLPPGLTPGRINDVLLNAARGRSLLPIRGTSAYKPTPSMQP